MNATPICINRTNHVDVPFELEPRRILKWLDLADTYKDQPQAVIFDVKIRDPKKPEDT